MKSSLGLAPDGVAAAFAALTRIDTLPVNTGRQRARLIDECGRITRANAIALCRVGHDSDVAILHLFGTRPDANAFDAILELSSSHGTKPFRTLRPRERDTLMLTDCGINVLCATFPPDAEPWSEQIVGWVADRLADSTIRSRRSDNAAPLDRNLNLPSDMVVGPSAAMRDLFRQMTATVASGVDVLLSGETGTGKELLARVVHQSGPTRNGPFVAINCAAIPAELLEAELFGVERRVATGVDPRAGLFIEADGGSIFLDEVAELPERLQAKLLRVIQEREVLSVGASRPRKISARIIAASNQDLARLIPEGRFRADLYYRLRGLEFHAPPLRERIEDIPPLALEFLVRAADEYEKDVAGISNAALALLQQYSWPGNVRELQTEIRRAVLLCRDGVSLDPAHFNALTPNAEPILPYVDTAPETTLLRDRLATIERAEIQTALRAAGGNQSLAARQLGITRNGLAHKLRRLGLSISNPRAMNQGLGTTAKKLRTIDKGVRE